MIFGSIRPEVDLDSAYELCPKCSAEAERLEPKPEGIAA
jgi:hypothetical protein